MKIRSISAYPIYDSRGNPTVEAEITLENGITGRGLVPSGASTGQFEALELRDGDPTKFRGKSVFRAIENIHQILAPLVIGHDVEDQVGLDQILIDRDGTPNKSRLGANAILAISLANAQAAAAYRRVPLFESLGRGTCLPLPEIQIFGGGAHAHWRTDVQDYLVIATGAKSYAETLEITFHIYQAAGDLMRARGSSYGVADEGGYWPDFATNEEALDVLVQAIDRAGYTPGEDAAISLDIAASDLYDANTGFYRFSLEDETFNSDAMIEKMVNWCQKYPIVSLEDPLADTDHAAWRQLESALGTRVQLIGDDLFTTHPDRIRAGIQEKLANAVLIKLNQIGTVTETLEAIRITQSADWNPVISARSGETEDAFISHLAVATDAGQLKVGSFTRSERMAKWNECLRIARHLGDRATFAGAQILPSASSGQ